MEEELILVSCNLGDDFVSIFLCFNAAASLQNHRSMVLHILSQLKLGMDLTRVSDLGMEI